MNTIERFDRYVIPNYTRYPVTLVRGEGSYIWSDEGKRYIDFFPGWGCDISKARKWEDLPKAARDYVEFIEARVGCPIKYVSVGAEREALIIRE